MKREAEVWELWQIDAWCDGEVDGEPTWVWNDKCRYGIACTMPVTASCEEIERELVSAIPAPDRAGLKPVWANDVCLEFIDGDGNPVLAAMPARLDDLYDTQTKREMAARAELANARL